MNNRMQFEAHNIFSSLELLLQMKAVTIMNVTDENGQGGGVAILFPPTLWENRNGQLFFRPALNNTDVKEWYDKAKKNEVHITVPQRVE